MSAQDQTKVRRLGRKGEVAKRYLGVSARTLDRMDAAGQTPKSLKLRGCKVWDLTEIENWIAAGCPSRRQWEQSKKGGRND
jgi:predicted DNA-binding transcriptional regulator AlpA